MAENETTHAVRHGKQHYREEFSRKLHQIRQNNDFCDIDIQVGGQTFRAHRVVLAAGSSYFHAMFCSGMMEDKADVITLYDIDPKVFSVLLDFIYLGDIDVTVDNCQGLMYAADMIGLIPVVLLCVNFLKENIQPYNCIGIYKCAATPNLQDLLWFAEDYINTNFQQVTKEEEFLELPYTDMIHWLKSENINVTSEILVLEAAVNWTEQDVDNRLRDLPHVLDCVRFPLINHSPMQELFSRVKNRAVVTAVRRYLQNCDILSNDVRSFPRKSSQRSIYLIGGVCRSKGGRWNDAFSLKTVEKYDPYAKTWESIQSITEPRSKHGACSINRQIYVVGGEDNLLIYDSVEIFTPQTETWTDGPTLNSPRCGLGLCSCDGKIYAFGGWVGSNLGDSIEMLDINSGEWLMYAKIPRPKFACGVVEMDGMIYTAGGTDTENDYDVEMSTVDSFNPVTKEWTVLRNMNVKRSDLALVALDGFLYAIGGYNDTNKELNSVERYSPEEDTWTFVSPMHEKRASPCAVGLNGLLYVMGGNQRLNDDPYSVPFTLDSFECYDPQTDTWKKLPPLPNGRSEAVAVVL